MGYLGKPPTNFGYAVWAATKFVSDRLADNSFISTGRLTLVSGDPVPAADQVGAGTVYYTPYNGDRVGVFDGSEWRALSYVEPSIALSGLTTDKNYDVFAIESAGAAGIELSAAWTNDTTRADAIVRLDGAFVKSSDHTRRLVGTFRATGAATTEDSKTKRFVSNFENRIGRLLLVTEGTDTWTQSTPNVWRSTNGSTANRVEVVCTDNTMPVSMQVLGLMLNNQDGSNNAVVSVGLDSTSVPSAILRGATANRTPTAANNHRHASTAIYRAYVGLGYHFLQQLEFTTSAGGAVWYGDDGGTNVQTGMIGTVMA